MLKILLFFNLKRNDCDAVLEKKKNLNGRRNKRHIAFVGSRESVNALRSEIKIYAVNLKFTQQSVVFELKSDTLYVFSFPHAIYN